MFRPVYMRFEVILKGPPSHSHFHGVRGIKPKTLGSMKQKPKSQSNKMGTPLGIVVKLSLMLEFCKIIVYHVFYICQEKQI